MNRLDFNKTRVDGNAFYALKLSFPAIIHVQVNKQTRAILQERKHKRTSQYFSEKMPCIMQQAQTLQLGVGQSFGTGPNRISFWYPVKSINEKRFRKALNKHAAVICTTSWYRLMQNFGEIFAAKNQPEPPRSEIGDRPSLAPKSTRQ